MKRLAGLVAGLAIVFGSVFMWVPKASAQVPPAAFLCQYISDHEIEPGGQLLGAEYKTLNTTYVEALCWMYYSSGGGVACTYYARYYNNGAASGPYQLDCIQ